VIADLKSRRLGRFGESVGASQPPLFTNTIPQTVAVASGADVDRDIKTLKGKYGSAYESLHGLTQEIKKLCEKKKL
jgi:chromosome partitioning protein